MCHEDENDDEEIRVYKAADFRVSADGGRVKIEVDLKTYLIDSEQARKISLEMASIAAFRQHLRGIYVSLDGDQYRLPMDQVIRYSYRVFACAQRILAQEDSDD